jgi:hypothetical protein
MRWLFGFAGLIGGFASGISYSAPLAMCAGLGGFAGGFYAGRRLGR